MKLKSILKVQSVETLKSIEDYWGISPARFPADADDELKREILIGNLYQRLQNPSLWKKVLDRLTREERDLVSFLAIHGGDLERSEVARRFFDGDDLKLEQAVSVLAERGIVFFDEVPDIAEDLVLVGIPEPFLRYIELPSYWEGYLGYFLKEKSNNELKHIATQGLRVAPESANKNYLIWLIRKNLLDPKFLRRYLERLPPGAQPVLDLIIERKGICVYRDLLELNVQKRYDHSRGDAIHWLLNSSGLLFTAIPGGNKYNNLLMVPRDISYIIGNHFQPDERVFQELDVVTLVEKENAPTIILDNSNTLLRDLVVFCNFVDRYPVKVLATGGIGKNDLKKVLPRLSRLKSLKYAEFLSLFAIQKKFLVSTGDSYRVANSFLRWLEDARTAYTELLTWWLKSADWNEEFIEGNTVHIEPRPPGLVSIASFRRVVIEALAEMPRDRWLVFSAFLGEVLPRIEQEIPGRGEPLQYDKHTRANALVVESIVAECLHWLGMVAIGLKNEKDAEAIGMRQGDGKKMKARGGSRGRPRKQHEVSFTFRITELGRFVLNRPADQWTSALSPLDENIVTPMQFDIDHFIIQPTHEVMVPPDLQLRTFYHLNEISDIRSIDVMSILAITRESIREGLDHGLRGEEILDFLRKKSRTPVPASLDQLVKECADKHGEVNMGFAGGYIVIDDEILLEQIRINRRISPHIKDIIDNRLVLLNMDVDVKRLARELQKIGFMPRLGSEHVYMKEDDMYQLSLTREDMYTLIAAVRFASQVRDGKGTAVSEERLMPLLERLKPDPRTFAMLDDLAEPLVKTWARAQENATAEKITRLEEHYKGQLTQIVSTAVPRGPSKHQFHGPNPAEETDDIENLLEFAVEHEFEVEILYITRTREEVSETVLPERVERDKLLARSESKNHDLAAYKIDRIIRAKLL